MQTYDARVEEIVRETPDAVSLVLDIGGPAEFDAGQFITIDPHAIDARKTLAKELEAKKKRKERGRAYSLGSAPHERLLVVTVKEEEEGEFPALVSPWLMREVTVGDTIPVTGFSGLYTLPRDLPPGSHLVHICAGSGIVPNFSIIKDVLHRGLPYRQTLLYSNRTWDDVIYADTLTSLAATSGGSLAILHLLTRDSRAPEGVRVRPSRIDRATLLEEIPDLADAHFFLCGPSVPPHERRAARLKGEVPRPRFLECMKDLLEELGVPRERVRSEGW